MKNKAKDLKDKITRSYTFEMRTSEEEETGIIEGRAIVYDCVTNLGWFDEVIAAGALDDTDLKDVRFLVNHNTHMIPLARSRNNNENSTMRLIVDEEGLFIRVKLDIENNTEAQALYSAIKRGDITGMSFMFTVSSEVWEGEETDHPKRTITGFDKIFEVSAVTFPAYEETDINARYKAELDSYRSTLENVRRNNAPEGVSDDDTLTLYKMKNRILGGI